MCLIAVLAFFGSSEQITIYFVNKIGSLERPACWNFVTFHLDLFAEYLVPDLFPISAIVRPAAEHQLICNDSDGIIIHRERMVLPAHDFRSHVARRTTSISTVIRLHYSCDSQIRDSQESLIIKHQILRLDIPMDDVIEMQELQSNDHTSYEKLGLIFSEPPPAAHMVPQIPADQQIHDQIQIFPVLKRIGHVDDKRMLQFRQQFSLIQHRMNTLLTDDLGLMHLFHCVYLLVFLGLDAPYLAESALADHVLAVEMLAVDLLAVQVYG